MQGRGSQKPDYTVRRRNGGFKTNLDKRLGDSYQQMAVFADMRTSTPFLKSLERGSH